MADICVVCGEKISQLSKVVIQEGITIHDTCIQDFEKEPEKFGGKVSEKTEPLTEEEKEVAEQRNQRRKEQAERDEASLQEIKDKSVYVKDLDMPIKSMVIFMVKWAVASIPAFIILAIIGAIFFAMFTAIFVSTR